MELKSKIILTILYRKKNEWEARNQPGEWEGMKKIHRRESLICMILSCFRITWKELDVVTTVKTTECIDVVSKLKHMISIITKEQTVSVLGNM